MKPLSLNKMNHIIPGISKVTFSWKFLGKIVGDVSGGRSYRWGMYWLGKGISGTLV